ncbi:MAG: hypothetical protein IPK60_21005 [Sandaracinaceae bacterium]|nr:hypothetical protein [Sandaracinaceae bacterium]
MAKAGTSTLSGWRKRIHQAGTLTSPLTSSAVRQALLGRHGTIGFIATNTIAQGDTRNTGLKRLVADGRMYAATRSMPWPGKRRSVSCFALHAARSPGRACDDVLLDRVNVAINSRLRTGAERPDQLHCTNESPSFVGSNVLGMGFTLTADERDALIKSNKKNAERIFPVSRWRKVNTSPTQAFDRYVINFGKMSLEEAEKWPDLLAILRAEGEARAGPNKRGISQVLVAIRRQAPALYEAIGPLERCLITARLTKHLVFAFNSTAWFSVTHTVRVSAHRRLGSFAVLQSRVHQGWARLLSSSMEDRLRYTASGLLPNISVPRPDPRTVLPELDRVGAQLYEARATYMAETQQGLTKPTTR